MKKFTITIEESISQDFVVYAEDEDSARAQASEKYSNGEFVLDNANLVEANAAITKVDDKDVPSADWQYI